MHDFVLLWALLQNSVGQGCLLGDSAASGTVFLAPKKRVQVKQGIPRAPRHSISIDEALEMQLWNLAYIGFRYCLSFKLIFPKSCLERRVVDMYTSFSSCSSDKEVEKSPH